MSRPDPESEKVRDLIACQIEGGLVDMREEMGIPPAPSVVNFPSVKAVFPADSLQGRIVDAVLFIEDMATFIESQVRDLERGNIERHEIVKRLRMGVEHARQAARTLEGA